MIEDVNQEVKNEELHSPIHDEAPVDKPESLRETIEKAREQVAKDSEETKEKPIKEKTIKVKSHERTVTKEDKPEVKVKDEVEIETPILEAKEPLIAPPVSFSAQAKAKWAETPKEIQQELAKREQDFHKELTKHDEERNFGRTVEKIVTPYMAQIKAEGATAPQAIENLLNMAHVLRVGSPQQKSDLLLRTAQTFGVDLRQALQVQQTQPQLPPQVQNALQEVQSIRQQMEQEKALKKQQEDSEIQSAISAFSADPKNVHFETVKAHMAALLKGGIAKDLQDAYEQAVYANPHTRPALLEQQQSASNEKRVAEQKARAEAARKAGSSIRGAPGIMATKDGKVNGLDLRSTIEAAMAKHMDS